MLVAGNAGRSVDRLARVFATQDTECLAGVMAVHLDQLMVIPVPVPAIGGMRQQLLPQAGNLPARLLLLHVQRHPVRVRTVACRFHKAEALLFKMEQQ